MGPLKLEPGTYVVAVSGGVDSVVLLDMLAQHMRTKTIKPFTLIVAHYDHGIRPDSVEDRRYVQSLAQTYGLPFIYDQGQLGPKASEAEARQARYNFLQKVRATTSARAILTAHHSDDALETTVLQLLRGSGRRGLSALRSQLAIERPLLDTTKQELKNYATARQLKWREDVSNRDEKYLRNYIRHTLLPRLTSIQKTELLGHIRQMRTVNKEADELLDLMLHVQPSRQSLDRRWFINLPHNVSLEVMAHWLRTHAIRSFDKKQLQKLVVLAKTLEPGKKTAVDKNHFLKITTNELALVSGDR